MFVEIMKEMLRRKKKKLRHYAQKRKGEKKDDKEMTTRRIKNEILSRMNQATKRVLFLARIRSATFLNVEARVGSI